MSANRIDNLVFKLERGREKTIQTLSSLSPDQRNVLLYEEDPAWNVRSLLAHFLSAEENLLWLAQNVAEGGKGAPEGFDFESFNQDEQQRLRDQSYQDLLTRLAERRQATLDWVSGLDETRLDRVGRHPALGQITVEEMILAIYGHQLLHMRVLQRKLSG